MVLGKRNKPLRRIHFFACVRKNINLHKHARLNHDVRCKSCPTERTRYFTKFEM